LGAPAGRPFLLAKRLSLAAALLWTGSAGCGGDRPSAAAPAPAVRPAPNFTLKDVSGRAVSLADFKGRVVLLDFWATWCPPCRESIPVLQKMHEEYSARGVTVLGVSVDQDASVVPPFVKRKSMSYSVLLDDAGEASDLYRVSGIPSLFLLNKDGVIVKNWVGFAPGMEAQWRRAVENLLAS
jgi:peroxiredoxin